MFNSLKNFFHQSEKTNHNITDDLHLLCGLMIEAANIDGQIDQQEIDKIAKVLIDTFHEEPSDVEVELKNA